MRYGRMMVLPVVLLGLVFGSQNLGAQGRPDGKVVRSYRGGEGGRPPWADAAMARSIAYLQANGAAHGLRNAANELLLRNADEDDLGLTHVRLDQVKDGVPVFAGQLISLLDNAGVREVSGRVFDAAAARTTPQVSAGQAIQAAQSALGYGGNFANQPEAKLVILPEYFSGSPTTLTYQVELLVEDGTEATGRYEYFVDAVSGAVVWSYNNMHTGGGSSLYSGQQSITTEAVSTRKGKTTTTTYNLRDTTRGGMSTNDVNGRTDGLFTQASGSIFTDSDDSWGTGAQDLSTTPGRQSAAVDAHFGAAKTWDYYLNIHGRQGIDNRGYAMLSRVHYGSNYNNAFWNGVSVAYGDGGGTGNFRPLVSVDVVAHEITHGLTEKTAGLVYNKESGALNESFSDIFGASVEFYVGNVGGRTPDYLVGEDIYIPEANGFRNMMDPSEDGHPDHYAVRNYPEPCTPSDTNDYCGVHTNSGISNHAFYLLSEGGTNRVSGLTVPGIGRAQAEKIFFRALTMKLTQSSTFSQARAATLQSAAELFPGNSTIYNATAQAWTAVGVN